MKIYDDSKLGDHPEDVTHVAPHYPLGAPPYDMVPPLPLPLPCRTGIVVDSTGGERVSVCYAGDCKNAPPHVHEVLGLGG